MNHLKAVIPVRKGSQRVKHKNFKKFADSNLLQLKIEQIKKLPVEEIIVNTDSEVAIDIAKENNISYFRREPYYASSKCTNSEYHRYLGETTESENILIAQVTSPLIEAKTYLKAIEIFFGEECDSLMSVTSFKDFLLFENEPFNFTKDKMPNSQDLPNYKIPTFGVILCKRGSLIKDMNYMCGNTFFYEISDLEAVDIDTPLDFKIAEFLYMKRKQR
jgi:CMP-N-acetylneuraminic acid synthetase